MATNLTLVRTVEITNGAETRKGLVYQAAEGIFYADGYDTSGDALTQIADESDTSINDVIRDNGFEVL